MNFLVGGVGLTVIAAVVAIMKKTDKGTIVEIDEIINDYRVLRTAFSQFRKSEKALCEDLKVLEPYFQEKREIQWERYSITLDQKFLVVNDAKSTQGDAIIKRIGSGSNIKNNKIYLSFSSSNTLSKVEPVADFRTVPADNITTTTNVEFDYSISVTEDNEIAEVEWDNMHSRYSTPGIKKIRLRVQDKNGNWSEWQEKQIHVKELKGIKGIATGHESVFILHKNGKVDGFGRNEFGYLATGDTSAVGRRQMLPLMENVDQIDGGDHHTIILTNDRKVMTVGRNHFGQLGQSDRTDLSTPKALWGIENVKQISSGDNFGAALTISGKVYTWGNNEHLQLGSDNGYFKETPAKVEGLENIQAISCGATHMLALGFDGAVYAWGDNRFGQLGLGYKSKSNEPALLNIKGCKAIFAGRNFSLAIMEDRKVMSWGNNIKSQCGLKALTEVLFPTEIPGLKDILKMSMKGQFVVALDTIGQVYTWGHYQGIDESYPKEPVKVADLKYIIDVAATAEKGYAINEKDEVISWGRNISKTEKVLFFDEDAKG